MHDGPVKEMAKCPFMPHLLMSVGGYSFAIWNEGVMVRVYLDKDKKSLKDLNNLCPCHVRLILTFSLHFIE